MNILNTRNTSIANTQQSAGRTSPITTNVIEISDDIAQLKEKSLAISNELDISNSMIDTINLDTGHLNKTTDSVRKLL
jgi:gamma-glutamyl phosphate reductase